MRALEWFVRSVDTLNEWVGRVTSWFTLGCVLVCFAVVVLRYAFNMGYVWLQELYVWQHAVVFMVGAGYTFLHGGHVRVDIVYGRMSPRRQAMIDIFGTLVFLLPWLAVVAWTSLSFISSSWSIREASSQTGGLQGLYLLKSVIWVFCALVGLQGLAMIGRSILYLSGREAFAPAGAGH